MSFCGASPKLLPTRRGGETEDRILKIGYNSAIIKEHKEFYARTYLSSLARRIYSPKHTTKCFEVRLNQTNRTMRTGLTWEGGRLYPARPRVCDLALVSLEAFIWRRGG